MDPKPDESSKINKAVRKHHAIKKMYERMTRKSSSSSSSSKKQEESKTSPDEKSEEVLQTEKSAEENTTNERPPSRSSPDTHCAICLEAMTNTSFTDSCLHQFCFTCLLEWSKVKPECPLCKQQFKSIVHNVRKDLTFDEYIISSRTTKVLSYYRTEQRFRYPTTMTTSRMLERNRLTYQESYQSQIASHRMRFAPHSMNPYSSSQIMSRLPCPFRRRVYDQNLWVKPPLRTRVATPEFYSQNPACTHRLVPWLNRELVSLWQDNEAQVTFVLELIMSLVVRYHINSQEFLIHIEPYMGRNTHHFIHEFYAYAISPYDMDNYDAHADYGLVPHSSDDADRSSPDSDVIAIFTGESTSLPRQNRERKQNMRKQALKHLRMILKKNTGANNWESFVSPTNNLLMSSSSWSNPGPSTSGFMAGNFLSGDANAPIFPSVSDIEQSDDDEIQVVDVVKPRTPEIVDLSSDDEVPVTVIDVSSGEENFSPVCSPSRPSPLLADNDDTSTDIECLTVDYRPSTSNDISTPVELSAEENTKSEEKQKELHHLSSTTEELESDDPTEVKKTPKLASAIVRPWTTENESSSKEWTPQPKRRFSSSFLLDDSASDKSDNERKPTSRKLKLQDFVSREGSDSERKPSPKKFKLKNFLACEDADRERKSSSRKFKLQSVVASEASDGERKPGSKKLKLQSFVASDDSDSEKKSSSRKLKLQSVVASEGSESERKSGSGKLQLQSVIAHWSLGGHSTDRNRYDSSHRSSHKKRKEKKKKKHKHTHKHKQRIYSDSDSA